MYYKFNLFYRLFSSALFNDEFPEWNLPEIQTTPIDNVILQMKSMKIDKITSFPFPTPPNKQTILEAERRLNLLGALEADKNIAGKFSELILFICKCNFIIY